MIVLPPILDPVSGRTVVIRKAAAIGKGEHAIRLFADPFPGRPLPDIGTREAAPGAPAQPTGPRR